jgi:DNA-directed RNA polymerase subunit RPC12/RpoP
MDDIMVICKKCGNKAPVSQMKMDYDEKLVICPECIKNKKIHKEIEKEVFHKGEEDPAKTEKIQSSGLVFAKKPETQEQPSSKMAHKCTSCGYKFKIDPETRTPKYCPYCNSKIMGF